MAIDLAGKPIIITGASSGIGRATALACAAAGMPVVLTARRRELLDEAADLIRATGGRALAFPMDVAEPEASTRAIEACIREFGGLYAVYANAGYGFEKPVHACTDDEVRAIFEVNFFGALNLIRPALPYLLKQRAGHILMCSSCLAKFSIPYFGFYSATKAAQNHICRSMNLELSPLGIHVSSVHPVGTRTEFFKTAQQLSGGGPIVQHQPDLFMQTPERVARATVKCLRKPIPEVWTSLFVRFGMAFSNAFPRLGDLGVRKMVREYTRLNGDPDVASLPPLSVKGDTSPD